MHLKDLVLLNTALHDKVEGVLINFRKMAQLSITFTELMLLQNSSLPVDPNMDLVNMIRVGILVFTIICIRLQQVTSFTILDG